MPGATIAAPAVSGRSTTSPVAASISAASSPPGRSSRMRPSSTFTMVDSSPTTQAPASRMSSIRCPRSASTWAALVGLMRPDGVGARCRERPAEGGDDAARKSVRHAHRHRIEPGGGKRVNGAVAFQRQDQRQRPRPEARRELSRQGIEGRMPLGHGHVGHMGDQRIEARPALDLVDAGDRLRLGGVGGQAIDGFGRNGDGLAAREHVDCRRNRLVRVASHIDNSGHRSHLVSVKGAGETKPPRPVVRAAIPAAIANRGTLGSALCTSPSAFDGKEKCKSGEDRLEPADAPTATAGNLRAP